MSTNHENGAPYDREGVLRAAEAYDGNGLAEESYVNTARMLATVAESEKLRAELAASRARERAAYERGFADAREQGRRAALAVGMVAYNSEECFASDVRRMVTEKFDALQPTPAAVDEAPDADSSWVRFGQAQAEATRHLARAAAERAATGSVDTRGRLDPHPYDSKRRCCIYDADSPIHDCGGSGRATGGGKK